MYMYIHVLHLCTWYSLPLREYTVQSTPLYVVGTTHPSVYDCTLSLTPLRWSGRVSSLLTAVLERLHKDNFVVFQVRTWDWDMSACVCLCVCMCMRVCVSRQER